MVGSWEAPSPLSAAGKGVRGSSLPGEHRVDFQSLGQKPGTSVLSACTWNGPFSLFRPCLDSWCRGRVTGLFPWLVTPKLGVLGSQGEAGEAPLMAQQLPLGWESQGYTGVTCKGRSLMQGKARAQLPRGTTGQAAALGCAATVEGAKKPSSLHSQDSSLPLPLPVSGIEDVQLSAPQRLDVRGQSPSAPHHMRPDQVGSALLHYQMAPGRTSLPKHSWPFGAIDFSSWCN